MFISKKKLVKYIELLYENNRKEKNGANYKQPISTAQQDKNIYLQGYEDGTDNFFNALCSKFKLNSVHHIGREYKER